MNNSIEDATTIYSENDIHDDGLYYDYANDRMITQLTSRCVTQNTVVENCYEAFLRFDRQAESCRPSRCEVRVRAEAGIVVPALTAMLPPGTEIACYPGGNLREYFLEGKIHHQELIIGLNNKKREMPDSYRDAFYIALRGKIRASIAELHKQGGAHAYALKHIEKIAGKAYVDNRLRSDVDVEQLHELWGATYNWSLEQCERYAQYAEQSHASSGNQLYLMREEGDGKIIATLLATHEGEGTAGATHPGSGHISRATAYFCLGLYVMSDWLCQSLDEMKNLPIPFAFTWPGALFASIYSGMWNDAVSQEAEWFEKSMQGQRQDTSIKSLETSTLINSFALDLEGTPPDSWNQDKGMLPTGQPFTALRSFTIVHLNRFFYGQNMEENLQIYRDYRKKLGYSS